MPSGGTEIVKASTPDALRTAMANETNTLTLAGKTIVGTDVLTYNGNSSLVAYITWQILT